MNPVFHPSGSSVRSLVFASALVFSSVLALGQTADLSGAAPASDAELRLKWLNSRLPPKVAAEAKAAPAKVAAAPKISFRSSPKDVGPRSDESATANSAPAVPAEKRTAESRPAEASPPKLKPTELVPAKTRSTDVHIAKATPAPVGKATRAPIAKAAQPKPTPAVIVEESTPAKADAAKSHVAEATPAPTAKATPAPIAKALPPKPTPPVVVGETPPARIHVPESRIAKVPPVPTAKPTPAPVAVAKPTQVPSPSETAIAKTRTAEARATPVPKPTPASAIASAAVTKPAPAKPVASIPARDNSKTRYPWKSGIVTTVFWIGEPVGGGNFTPNYSSSWDAHWTRNFGGLDTPDPDKRRNFIPAKFIPRQNPFYVALPYNDVTRGTTKPEARRVIPWFREAYRGEGQSVCRDRWVAIRNRAGHVVYAQWSDCGPFRTDHWQYVFGSDRPRPNLNHGAGLDVSPAVRDYLGLDSTDVTDWRFVDFKDVPSGPWARYGQNNTFVLNDSRPSKSSAEPAAPTKAKSRNTDTASRVRLGGL